MASRSSLHPIWKFVLVSAVLHSVLGGGSGPRPSPPTTTTEEPSVETNNTSTSSANSTSKPSDTSSADAANATNTANDTSGGDATTESSSNVTLITSSPSRANGSSSPSNTSSSNTPSNMSIPSSSDDNIRSNDSSLSTNATRPISPEPIGSTSGPSEEKPDSPGEATGASGDCTLKVAKEFQETIGKHLRDTSKMIDITLKFSSLSSDQLQDKLTGIYKPDRWLIAKNRKGRSLLMLDDNYGYMSMSTLTIGVVDTTVNVTDEPSHCLDHLDKDQMLRLIREALLDNFQEKQKEGESRRRRKRSAEEDVELVSVPVNPEESVCNEQIEADDGYAKFRYHCCHRNNKGDLECEDMHKNNWMKVILVFIAIVKILVVLYSPVFLPGCLYRLKYTARRYIHHLTGGPKTLNVVVTDDLDKVKEDELNKVVSFEHVRHMENFKAEVSNWTPGQIYQVELENIDLTTRAHKLLEPTEVPVGIFYMLYVYLVRCRLRHLTPLKACCQASVFECVESCRRKGCQWYKCMRVFATMCLFLVIMLPWIIRLALYFCYEKDEMDEKHDAAEAVGLELRFYGNFIIYFAPVHILFIVICIILLLDVVVYNAFSRAVKEKFKFILRECFRDMREVSRAIIAGWMVKLIVLPFTKCGLFGFVFFIPYLALLIIVTVPIALFYIFPTINLSIRLIIHFFIFLCPGRCTQRLEKVQHGMSKAKDKLHMQDVVADEKFIKRTRFECMDILLQIFVVIVCFVSFWAITFLLMEIISFVVQLLIYTFMGVIVNAGSVLHYVIILFLVFMYAKNTFSRYYKLYLDYHKVIHDYVVTRARTDVQKLISSDSPEYEDRAFVITEDVGEAEEVTPSFKVKHNEPHWETSSLLVFLDRHAQPMTPEKFFMQTINLNHHGCPGPIYINVMHAFWEMARILLFLLFVLIVVMAFGDAYKVSSTNQLLATVAGGFIPFFFRSFFKSSSKVSVIDPDSVQFKVEVNRVINAYNQSWPVFDIIPSCTRSLHDPTTATQTIEDEEAKIEAEAEAKLTEHDKDGEEAEGTKMEEVIVKPTIELPEVDLIVDISSLNHCKRKHEKEETEEKEKEELV